MKKMLCLALVLCVGPHVLAQEWLAAGRAGVDAFRFELYGGWGGLQDVQGSWQETRNGRVVADGVNVDLQDLGLEDEFSTFFFGAKAYNAWVTFLLDVRSTSLEASGTAEREYRLAVDDLLFAGQRYEYLIIPTGVDYDIDAEMNVLGLGVRVTPLTVNPEGAVTFTPWLHLGLQAVQADYNVDAGGTVGIEVANEPQRVYARRGQADGQAEAGIPEYGFGGEVRIRLHEPGERGLQLVADATYKILDFQGAIDSLGIDGEEFEDIDFQYSALEANLLALIPLKTVDLMAGLYLESVDVEAVLESEGRNDAFDREVDASYTLWGAKIGLLF